MILIADSGSTKTDWILLDLESGQRINYTSEGLNPYYSDLELVSKTASGLFHSLDKMSVTHIYFYGSGCSTVANKQIIQKGLGIIFPESKIEVFHDLEGASRALCRTNAGIACILGTGSNAALFDGNQIVTSAVSLGYLLGDEGSGNHLGKKLIHAIYLKTAPEELIRDFHKTFGLTLEKLLIELYQKPSPNRFLASFTIYIAQNKINPYLMALIYANFEEFIQLVVAPLNKNKKLPLHFTGSVAWFFKEELKYVVEQSGYIMGRISQKPIEDLAEYHLALKNNK